MPAGKFSFKKQLLSMLLLSMAFFSQSFAQRNPDSTKTTIYILDSDYSEYIQHEGKTVQKLMHNVKLLHESDTLYCDSAFFYQSQNGFEAFGDVAIYQADGTEAFADYMRYTGNNKLVYMRSWQDDVRLSDNQGNNLWSKEIHYDLNTKIGTYKRGGTLQSDGTILSSNTGTYNTRTKDARFKGNVEVSDPEYFTTSTDLGYNTESKIVRFFGPSVVTNDKSVLQTSSGTYNTKDSSGYFINRSSILNESQYIEADTLDYDRKTGLGIAIGNVIAIDTGQQSTLYSGQAIYNEITGILVAYDKPLMKTINENDSLFIKADTFYSEPITTMDSLTAQDSLQLTSDILHRSAVADKNPEDPYDSTEINASEPPHEHILTKDTATAQKELPDDTLARPDSVVVHDLLRGADSAAMTDTAKSKIDALKNKMDILVYAREPEDSTALQDTSTAPFILANQDLLDSTSQSYTNRPERSDSSRPRYFIAYHNVMIFSDSLQGKCDSLRYAETDSLMRMYINPVLWQEGSQITGDLIFLQSANQQLKELTVPSNAIMISRSGPETAGMFDQIQGNVIKGYFKENKLDTLTAGPNAESIYFVMDEDDAYLGVSEANSDRLEILFEKGKIKTIYYHGNVEQTMTPMQFVHPKNLRLARYHWREDERPKTLEEFLDGTTLPLAPELIRITAKSPDQDDQ